MYRGWSHNIDTCQWLLCIVFSSLQMQIQQKTTQIDQINTELQRRDEVIQQKDVELRQKDDELQLKDVKYRGCQDMIRQINVCTI